MAKKAMFAEGCFWQVELDFANLEGVLSTQVGYSGGTKLNPSYAEVCTDRTGHAEVVLVEFDPQKISYEDLLETFWATHNPTELNRQGMDIGRQYRSAIFYFDDEQRGLAEKSRKQKQVGIQSPIMTEITAVLPFYRAEEYHQSYLVKHGQATCKIPARSVNG